MISCRRMRSGPVFKFRKKHQNNKIVNFPTKMKRTITASTGRLSYGTLKGALVILNMVSNYYYSENLKVIICMFPVN